MGYDIKRAFGRAHLTAAALALLAIGCGMSPQTTRCGTEFDTHVSSTLSPIYNGLKVAQGAFDGTFYIGNCTANAITHNLAITARHCVVMNPHPVITGVNQRTESASMNALVGKRAIQTLVLDDRYWNSWTANTRYSLGAADADFSLLVFADGTFDIDGMESRIAAFLKHGFDSGFVMVMGFGVTETGGTREKLYGFNTVQRVGSYYRIVSASSAVTPRGERAMIAQGDSGSLLYGIVAPPPSCGEEITFDCLLAATPEELENVIVPIGVTSARAEDDNKSLGYFAPLDYEPTHDLLRNEILKSTGYLMPSQASCQTSAISVSDF